MSYFIGQRIRIHVTWKTSRRIKRPVCVVTFRYLVFSPGLAHIRAKPRLSTFFPKKKTQIHALWFEESFKNLGHKIRKERRRRRKGEDDDDRNGEDGRWGLGRHPQKAVGREGRKAGAAIGGGDPAALRQRQTDLPLPASSARITCPHQDLWLVSSIRIFIWPTSNSIWIWFNLNLDWTRYFKNWVWFVMGSIGVGYENYIWIWISINLHMAFYIRRIGHELGLIGLVGVIPLSYVDVFI